WWKRWPCRCIFPCNGVFWPCRHAVSKHKCRYTEQDGFDLDLTYVTDAIIVTGFPATGIEHLYRNPRTEVCRFLDLNHPESYKVFNFASEAGRHYDGAAFNGEVIWFPFMDHTCPPLALVVAFCE
ncbi:unnamed protein product, partial [Phaeothamnion confervicola]